MNPITDRLNPYAMVVEEAQTQIRTIIKNAYLTKASYEQVIAQLTRIINAAAAQINIETLKRDTAVSLWAFARRQKQLWESIGLPAEITLFLGLYAAKGFRDNTTLNQKLSDEYRRLQPTQMGFGVPMNKYYKDVWERDVKPVVDELVKQKALDPNDYTGRNSLRNLAEMEARYKKHNDDIDELKEKKIKLVVCSSHADCSDRCAAWQGRVYSLDGTTGTIDGHKYIPLEIATDIWYTTKAGRRYKNGLLGFNCRHHLSEYKGQLLPAISAEERKKEYDITLNQRRKERIVRHYEAEALMYKNLSVRDYKKAKTNAKLAYDDYVNYCMDNDRAYYPSRTEL